MNFQIRAEELKDRYTDVARHEFGCTRVIANNGHEYLVRDLHYEYFPGHFGMVLIPVADASASIPGTGAGGSELIDSVLKAAMGLGPADPIYAIATYIRPDEHRCNLMRLPYTSKALKGHQHLGSYLGKGKTTHAPRDYHPDALATQGHCEWGVRGYPANLHVVSMEGVPQAILNRNAQMVDVVLNYGVRSSSRRTIRKTRLGDLSKIIHFYRTWLQDTARLGGNEWLTNCSDHKMLVLNLAVNIPHNLSAFVELFGSAGSKLFDLFRERYFRATGSPFGVNDETYFEPLWKRAGADTRKPGIVHGETNLAWRPESLVDAVGDFIDSYAGVQRCTIGENFLLLGHIANSLSRALENPPDVALASLGLAVVTLLRGQHGTGILDGVAWTGELQRELLNFVSVAVSPKDRPHFLGCIIPAWIQALKASSGAPPRARPPTATEAGPFQCFYSPGLIHRVGLGRHRAHPAIRVRTVCTAMDYKELEVVRA
jgi:hypothetical protein